MVGDSPKVNDTCPIVASAESVTNVTGSSPKVDMKPIREGMVTTGVGFLLHPSVEDIPVSKRIEFLRNKGLTNAEIEESQKRSNRVLSETSPEQHVQNRTVDNRRVSSSGGFLSRWASTLIGAGTLFTLGTVAKMAYDDLASTYKDRDRPPSVVDSTISSPSTLDNTSTSADNNVSETKSTTSPWEIQLKQARLLASENMSNRDELREERNRERNRWEQESYERRRRGPSLEVKALRQSVEVLQRANERQVTEISELSKEIKMLQRKQIEYLEQLQSMKSTNLKVSNVKSEINALKALLLLIYKTRNIDEGSSSVVSETDMKTIKTMIHKITNSIMTQSSNDFIGVKNNSENIEEQISTTTDGGSDGSIRIQTDSNENMNVPCHANIVNKDFVSAVSNEESKVKSSSILSTQPTRSIDVLMKTHSVSPDVKAELIRMTETLDRIRKNNSSTLINPAKEMLIMVLNKVILHSDVPRYQKLHTTNEFYKQKIAPLHGHEDFLESVGFHRSLTGITFEWKWSHNSDCEKFLPILRVAVDLLKTVTSLSDKMNKSENSGNDYIKMTTLDPKLNTQEQQNKLENSKETTVSSNQIRNSLGTNLGTDTISNLPSITPTPQENGNTTKHSISSPGQKSAQFSPSRNDKHTIQNDVQNDMILSKPNQNISNDKSDLLSILTKDDSNISLSSTVIEATMEEATMEDVCRMVEEGKELPGIRHIENRISASSPALAKLL